MLLTTKTLQAALAASLLLVATLPCANAGIFSTNFSGGGYTGGVINYTVDMSPGPAVFLSTGDFLTLYDAGFNPINLAGFIANPALFSITTNLTNTPATGILGIVDNPAITNIRFTYIGSGTISGNLGTFSLPDPSGGFRIVSIDDRHNGNSVSDGSLEGAPLLPTPSVPDTGSSMLLAVLGMTGLFALQRGLSLRKPLVRKLV